MDDRNHERATSLSRELCELMGWEFRTCPRWTGLRKAAVDEAVVIGLDRLEEIIHRLRTTASVP